MSFGFLLLAFVAVVNPARVRLGAPEDEGTGRVRAGLVALGSLAAFAVSAALVGPAAEILAALDVSPESFRLATGLVLAFEGAWTFTRPSPSPGPALPGRLGALVPVAFPLLVTPGLVALALGAGADTSTAEALGAVAAALVLASASATVQRSPLAAVALSAAARLFAAAEIVAGVVIAAEGVRDV